MILVDVNLLLYAYDPDSPNHERTRAWFEEVVQGHETVLIPWQNVHAFLRIMTNNRIYPNAFTSAEVRDIVSAWVAAPSVQMVGPADRHWDVLQSLIEPAQVAGPLYTDAVLAALAIEHGATLYSNDRGFRRFDGIRLVNPLES